MVKFKQSPLAHKYLDGLRGIEIGGSAHNPFGLKTLNVSNVDDPDNIHLQEQIRLCCEILPVDILSEGDDLPFKDKTFDFILTSHVIEHFWDPIKAMKEWQRIARNYLFIVVSHKERTFDKDRDLTTLYELIGRHTGAIVADNMHEDFHHSVWLPITFQELLTYIDLKIIDFLDEDDKVGNGFTFVIGL